MSCPKCKSKKAFRVDKDTFVRIRNGHLMVKQHAPGTSEVAVVYLPIEHCPFCGDRPWKAVKR